MKKYYTISEVAERTGISAHTLRYYDKEGLLSFVKRSPTGIRRFAPEDFEPLYTITVLKRSGMSIKEIRRFMELYLQGNETIHERMEMFEKQRESLQKQIEELQKMLKIVEYKCWYFKEAEKKGDINYYLKLPKEEVDERIKEFNETVNDFREGLLHDESDDRL
ncbi:MAG: MerR family transcriptional regulator [Solobacterium sp.]|nr:MerR family transcriptional regulator [Solobacterium sp.]